MLKVGVIGCGAIMQKAHLPALAITEGIKAEWLVDLNDQAVAREAQRFGIPHTTQDYKQVTGVDAVIIATPPGLHLSMCSHFLQQGVHVLCEKPLTIRADETRELVKLAKEKSLVFSVGLHRRYHATHDFIRQVIESGWLGKLERIDGEEGGAFDWECQSTGNMAIGTGGGGVLIDTGSHTLDCIMYWLRWPETMLQEYRDNSPEGLIETDSEMTFTLPCNGAEVPVRVELSRTRTLRNTLQVFFEHGMIEAAATRPSNVWFQDKRLARDSEEPTPIRLALGNAADIALGDYYNIQMEDFAGAICEGREPKNSALAVAPLVQLIEDCYANRQPLDEPWVTFQTDTPLLEGLVL